MIIFCVYTLSLLLSKESRFGVTNVWYQICTLDKKNAFVYDIDGRRFIMLLTIHFFFFMPLDFVNDMVGIFRVIT